MIKKTLCAMLVFGASAVAQAGVLLQESFDDAGTLGGNGWLLSNLSTPSGVTPGWYQGDQTILAAHSGGPASYLAANYANAAAGGVLDNWLISPAFSVLNGATVSFWLRAAPDPGYTDTISVGVSDGSGDPSAFTLTNAFQTSTSGWLQYTVYLQNNSTGVARFGINYNGLADTSNYVGVDSFQVSAVPEPASIAMLGAGLLVLLAAHRRRRQG